MRMLEIILTPPQGIAQWIVFILFAGLSLAMGAVGVREYLLQRRLLAHARPVDAIILRSEVIVSKSADTDHRLGRDNSTTSHRPEVLFRYVIDGTTRESDMLYPNVIVQGYASAEGAAAVLKPFPLDATVTAYVDPAHPDRGFLIRQGGAGPVVFMVVGSLLVVVLWFAVRLV